MKLKIAVVVSADGFYRCAGPYDFDEGEHNDAMDAARTWVAEAGEIIVSSWWVEASLPDPIREPLIGHVTEVAGS